MFCGSPELLLNWAAHSRIAWSDSYTCPLVWDDEEGFPGYFASPQIEHTCARHLFCSGRGCLRSLVPLLAFPPHRLTRFWFLSSAVLQWLVSTSGCDRDSRSKWRCMNSAIQIGYGGVENPFMTITHGCHSTGWGPERD